MADRDLGAHLVALMMADYPTDVPSDLECELAAFRRRLVEDQIDLSDEQRRLLVDNLWALYG